jgi:hypothetical protein
MYENVIKFLEIAKSLQESGVHFFSKSARRFHRFDDLKSRFESLAKSKVADKYFINELLSLARQHKLNISKDITFDFDNKSAEAIIEETLVVGDHSLQEDVLKSAFMYLRENIRIVNILKESISGFDDEFSKILTECKVAIELVKSHIHSFTEEVKFYGYE